MYIFGVVDCPDGYLTDSTWSLWASMGQYIYIMDIYGVVDGPNGYLLDSRSLLGASTG